MSAVLGETTTSKHLMVTSTSFLVSVITTLLLIAENLTGNSQSIFSVN